MSRIGSLYMELGARDAGLVAQLAGVKVQATGAAGGINLAAQSTRVLAAQSGHAAAALVGTFNPGLGAIIGTITQGVMGLSTALKAATTAGAAMQVVLPVLGMIALAVGALVMLYKEFAAAAEKAAEAAKKALEVVADETGKVTSVLADLATAHRKATKTDYENEVAGAKDASAKRLVAAKEAIGASADAQNRAIMATAKTYEDARRDMDLIAKAQIAETAAAEKMEAETLAAELAKIARKAQLDKEKGEKEASDKRWTAFLKKTTEAAEREKKINEAIEKKAIDDHQAALNIIHTQDEVAQGRRETRLSLVKSAYDKAKEALKLEEPRFQAVTDLARQMAIAGAKGAEVEPTEKQILEQMKKDVVESEKHTVLLKRIAERPEATAIIPKD